jgi:hypothetical protein
MNRFFPLLGAVCLRQCCKYLYLYAFVEANVETEVKTFCYLLKKEKLRKIPTSIELFQWK